MPQPLKAGSQYHCLIDSMIPREQLLLNFYLQNLAFVSFCRSDAKKQSE